MSVKKNDPVSCDWKKKSAKKDNKSLDNKSRLYRCAGNFAWRGIKTELYKPIKPAGKDWAEIVRQTLIGNHGETTKFHLRYFEIAPGGFSSLEMHKHEHVVIGIRGKGICAAGKKKYEIGFLDTLYIKPGEPHQLRNISNKPFGFFCIVNAKRDRPKILDAHQ
jgi:ribulose-bisphosphate carboxylase large chain